MYAPLNTAFALDHRSWNVGFLVWLVGLHFHNFKELFPFLSHDLFRGVSSVSAQYVTPVVVLLLTYGFIPLWSENRDLISAVKLAFLFLCFVLWR